jgi:hypothetical protein
MNISEAAFISILTIAMLGLGYTAGYQYGALDQVRSERQTVTLGDPKEGFNIQGYCGP